jgi:hypothetical protein
MFTIGSVFTVSVYGFFGAGFESAGFDADCLGSVCGVVGFCASALACEARDTKTAKVIPFAYFQKNVHFKAFITFVPLRYKQFLLGRLTAP